MYKAPGTNLGQLCVFLLSTAVFTLASAAPGNSGKDEESTDTLPDPVLFVHGYSSGASIWDTMVDRFKADGWPEERLRAFSYNYNQSNKTTAEEVAAEVQALLERTGVSRVDIITHSMGGLSSRFYAKFLDGDETIDAWVSLAGPNHGTNWGYGCVSWSCFEMRPGSNFLSELNKGKETPGDMRYATWRSACDTIIDPTDSVILKGADNTKKLCISHNWFVYDSEVYGEVRNFVE